MALKIKRRLSSFVVLTIKRTPGVDRAERQSRCIGNWLSRNTIDESYRRCTEQPIEVEPNLADPGNFLSHTTASAFRQILVSLAETYSAASNSE